MQPSLSPSVHHVGVVASHVERTTHFYVTLLGGDIVPLSGHTLVVAGEIRIAIVAHAHARPTFAHGMHLALAFAEDARASMRARLDALGAPHETVRGRVYTRDPDGFVIELLFT